ncbi:SDR family NAD(P)-dependent oxidoreductase [Mesorhizobium sp. M7D.F.Ca.US.004.03.1.1]|uniref:SDR family NAD(P)-dependent oxidoreductase n=1 Tax=Mesorhizobium sp. M7D.F.Ca.US.004.03.1.1 TaxID=2496702 RepID=UPI000FCAF103|nr:SDR family NAD(P)-dependent oxidoreductase [Mesorhizobium sp. M7D.F.Ca.US.004.03.1.1]RVA16269.1 SDR family NAD(P)-dependent oxidoreductase [Mesorhizobium sp. M7D.F.Ca.US.004.03.1.1]
MNGIGNVVLLTGAAGGIGRSIAHALLGAEVSVVAVDRDRARLALLAAAAESLGGRIETLVCDVTNQPAVEATAEAAIATMGRIDALIHCAGKDAPSGRAWEESAEHWRDIIDVDLNAVWWSTRAVLPHMISRGSGRIILISSVAGRIPTGGASVAYNTAKAGINGLTIALSAQVEGSGVLVNAIAPGPTGTGTAMTSTERVAYRAMYPLGEGGPEPVARACLYLLGPGGDWVSGSILNVSGGRYRG